MYKYPVISSTHYQWFQPLPHIGQGVSIFAARSDDQRQQWRMGTRMYGGAHDGEVGASAGIDAPDEIGRFESAEGIDEGARLRLFMAAMSWSLSSMGMTIILCHYYVVQGEIDHCP